MIIKKVLVTGATGKTGSLVLKKLRQRTDEFQGIGFARSQEKVKTLFDSTEGFFLGDIREPSSLESALDSCDGLVILTSATPKMKAPPEPGKRPEFEFPEGEYPEIVDWLGQKNQIDAAKKAQVKQIVLVGSMLSIRLSTKAINLSVLSVFICGQIQSYIDVQNAITCW